MFKIGPPSETKYGESGPSSLIGLVWFMVLTATLNNISVILWRSVLLVEKTGFGVPGENHQPTASHRQILSHNVV